MIITRAQKEQIKKEITLATWEATVCSQGKTVYELCIPEILGIKRVTNYYIGFSQERNIVSLQCDFGNGGKDIKEILAFHIHHINFLSMVDAICEYYLKWCI